MVVENVDGALALGGIDQQYQVGGVNVRIHVCILKLINYLKVTISCTRTLSRIISKNLGLDKSGAVQSRCAWMGGGAQILSNLANLSNVESVFRQRKWRFLETTLLHPKCLKACYHAPSLAWDQSKLGWLIYSLCALLFDDDAVKSAGKTRNHEGSFITVKPFLVCLEFPGPVLTLQKSFISAGKPVNLLWRRQILLKDPGAGGEGRGHVGNWKGCALLLLLHFN